MATYQVFKETTLPGTLQANSIYLVAPAAKPDYVEMYVTGSSASTVKRIINDVDVQDMIDTSVASQTQLEVVTDITARNALTPARRWTMCSPAGKPKPWSSNCVKLLQRSPMASR